MYPIETITSTDTTQDLVQKYNNLALHNRGSWQTIPFTISVSAKGSHIIFPAKANTLLLLPAQPHGFLIYQSDTLEENEAPIISLETGVDAEDVVAATRLSPIPFEVVELTRVQPFQVVDISINPLRLNVLQEAPIANVNLYIFLHVLIITP
jgi:hypothetical protein